MDEEEVVMEAEKEVTEEGEENEEDEMMEEVHQTPSC